MVYPLFVKSQTFSVFLKFKNYVENQLSHKIKALQTDGDGEFMSKQFQHYLSTIGIFHHISCPYTPEQNGAAESKRRHIVEMGL